LFFLDVVKILLALVAIFIALNFIFIFCTIFSTLTIEPKVGACGV
jgi:hypothetical protein